MSQPDGIVQRAPAAPPPTPAAGHVHSASWSPTFRPACDAPMHMSRPVGTKANQEVVVSRWDRLLIFGACNLAALACFVICFTLFPVLSLRPRKFVIL